MTLEDLLDELRGNVLRDDAELAAGPDDRLWTDESLVRYLNDAQRRFARRTLVLRDASTAEVVEVVLATDIASYTLHKSVRAVTSARYDTDTADLGRIGHRTLSESQPEEAPTFDANSVATLAPGRPMVFLTDEALDIPEDSAVILTVYPTPAAAQNNKLLRLRVARMPLKNLDIEDSEASPEIPEDYHLDLCEWAAYRALRNSDIDGHSARAKDHEARFNMAMAEVMKDTRNKTHAPLRWDFGRNGFSWGR